MHNKCRVMTLTDSGDKYWYEHRNYTVLKILLKKRKIMCKVSYTFGREKNEFNLFQFLENRDLHMIYSADENKNRMFLFVGVVDDSQR